MKLPKWLNKILIGFGLSVGAYGTYKVVKNADKVRSVGSKINSWFQKQSSEPGPTQTAATNAAASAVIATLPTPEKPIPPTATTPQLQQAAVNPNANVANTQLNPQFTVVSPSQLEWLGSSQRFTSPQGGDINVRVIAGQYDVFLTGRYTSDVKVACAAGLTHGLKGTLTCDYNLGCVFFIPKGSSAPSFNKALDSVNNIWLPKDHINKKSFGSM